MNTVLQHACGSIGARVTGMCSTTKTDLVRSIGADDVIDYTRDEVDARGPQYDVILAPLGAGLRRSRRSAPKTWSI